MSEIKLDAFKYALITIDDGWLFESFALSFLSAQFKYQFIPVGGSKDKGIDGIHYTFQRKGFEKQIFQLSTEKDAENKGSAHRYLLETAFQLIGQGGL